MLNLHRRVRFGSKNGYNIYRGENIFKGIVGHEEIWNVKKSTCMSLFGPEVVILYIKRKIFLMFCYIFEKNGVLYMWFFKPNCAQMNNTMSNKKTKTHENHPTLPMRSKTMVRRPRKGIKDCSYLKVICIN